MRLLFAWLIGILSFCLLLTILPTYLTNHYYYGYGYKAFVYVLSARLGMAVYYRDINAKVSFKGNLQCILGVLYTFFIAWMLSVLTKIDPYGVFQIPFFILFHVVFAYVLIKLPEKITKYYGKHRD